MIEHNGKTGFLRIEHRRAGIGRLVFVENGSVRSVGAVEFGELVKVHQHLPIRVEFALEHFEQGHATATSILVEYPICTPHSKIEGGLIHMDGGMVPRYVPLSLSDGLALSSPRQSCSNWLSIDLQKPPFRFLLTF